MSAKNSSRKSKATWQNEIQFSSWRLTTEQKKAFEAAYEKNGAELVSMLDTVLLAGYKVSLSFDSTNQTTIVSLTAKNEADPNYNWCLTTRHHDAYRAIALAMYKHFDLCDDCIWPVEESGYYDIG